MTRLCTLSLSLTAAVLLGACSGCATQTDTRDLAVSEADAAADPEAPQDTAPPRAEDIIVAIPPAPATPPPESPPTSLEALVPWFSPAPYAAALADWHAAHLTAKTDDPDAQAAADALRQRAITALTAVAAQDESRAAPASFMAAWIESERQLDPLQRVALGARFEQLATSWPLMEDVARVKAARLYEEGGSNEAALMALDRLGDPTASSSIHRAEAIELEALLLTRQGRPDDARAHLEAVASRSLDLLTAAAWRQLAELRPDEAARQRAFYELARRFASDPLGREAFEALKRNDLSPAQRLTLGKALFDASRYEAMRATLAGAVKATPEACEGWVLIGRSLERTNRRKKDKAVADRAFAAYEKALACDGEPRAEATFLGGRNRIARGLYKKGKALLEDHVSEFPKRSTADDAKLLLAQEEARATKKPATRKLLQTLHSYPTGDMADQVAWELVMPHLEKRRWPAVLEALDEILKVAPRGIPGRHAGRYPYWRARALLALGRPDEARAGFREVFLQHPLSWYAVLAWSRLTAEDPELGPTLLAEAARTLSAATDGDDAPPPPEDEDPVTPAPEAEAALPPSSADALPALWRDPHFRRAIEWARLAGGRYDEPSPLAPLIERELDAVPRAVRPDPATWAWTRVAVLQLGGAYSRSMRIARSAQSSWPMPFPEGDAARAWRLAYPQPFADHVARWSTERGLPPAWLWGVMRVESNFEPTAVSWANAIGLMQIILPTAQSLVRDTPHAPTRENLMRPAIAVELGSKYLGRLLARHKVIPLASAGYNAGGGAVGKWRRQFGDVEVDEFVERIPYREAHLYAKSVTQTMARYLWLYEGQMLTLDLRPVGHPDQDRPTE